MNLTRLDVPAFLLLFCFVLSGCTTSQEMVQETTPESEAPSAQRHHDVIAEVIPQMPASDRQEQVWLSEQLIDMGPDGLSALLKYLTPPGLGDDTFARYAVSGITKHVSRPGAESDRQMVEDVLLAELSSGRANRVSAFLLHQLELIGSDRSVPVVRQFLVEEDLYEPAAGVLVAIQTPSGVQALQQALDETGDPARQETLIKSLGDTQVMSVAGNLLPFASHEEWPVRRAALYALAQSGAPEAIGTITEAADTTRDRRGGEVRAFYLLLAERLVEEGHTAQSAEIARGVLGTDYPANMKHAALATLVQAEGDQAIETLADFGTNPDRRLRLGALSLASELPGQGVSEAFVSKLDEVDSEVRSEIISMLGSRGDASVLPTLSQYLQDSDPQTRLAAAKATATLNEEEALPILLTALNRAEDSEESREIEILLRQMPTDQLVRASAEALPGASDSAKVVLIRALSDRRGAEHLPTILEERTNTDEAVRLEVYRALKLLAAPTDFSDLVGYLSDTQSDAERAEVQDAMVTVLNRMESPEDRDDVISAMLSDATEDQKRHVLEILPQIGGDEALDQLVEAANSSNPEVQGIAIGALSEWSDSRAIPVLLEISLNAETSEQRSKLLEQYVRLVGTSEFSNSEKLERVLDAAATARSPEERAVVIGSMTMIDRPVALRAVGEHLTDPDELVKERANEVAVELLTSSINPAWTPLQDVEFLSALLQMNGTSEIARQFEEQLSEARARGILDQPQNVNDEIDTFSAEKLFNGDNLDGWEPVGGSSGGWDVSNGVLFTDGSGGGWLSTTEMYDNYVLELEYRVPEGGNSGVFLRAPREGNPAYQGMEIQILDDYADQYANLHAWQYTGSIYDVKAPSHRVSKSAGEWQTMEIVANGPVVQVVLNGEMIVNANLTNHMHLANDHPGLKRREGYIGLQNHSTRIEYRNIVIHELNQPDK